MEQTFTITYGDRAENHKGMQIIGKAADVGFTLSDLERARKWFGDKEFASTIYNLLDVLPEKLRKSATEAYVLHIPGGVNAIVDADDFYNEQLELPKDTKAYMYGRVVNKNARYNLCFGPNAQEPDYEQKKGRVVAYDQVPCVENVKQSFVDMIGNKGDDMMAEGNYYYNPSKCGIGFHGDGERKKVIAVRLGVALPLHYQWFINNKPIGERFELIINHGDVYIMSEKAVGFDWKRKTTLTLRHAAGAKKYLTIKDNTDEKIKEIQEIAKKKNIL